MRQAVARGADARVLVTAMAGRRLRVRALLLSTRRQTRAAQRERQWGQWTWNARTMRSSMTISNLSFSMGLSPLPPPALSVAPCGLARNCRHSTAATTSNYRPSAPPGPRLQHGLLTLSVQGQ